MEIARKLHNCVGNLSDVVKKARLYDSEMAQSRFIFGAKIVKVLVDYVAKVEHILAKMWILFVEPEQVKALKPMPLEKILAISIEIKVLLLLEDLVGVGLQEMATPSQQTENLETLGLN